MEKKKIFAVSAVAIIAVAIGLTLGTALIPSPKQSVAVTEQLGVVGVFEVHVNGVLVTKAPNTLTNLALGYLRNTTFLSATPGLHYLNVTNMTLSNGTTAPATTDTVCEATIIDGNGLSPAQSTAAIATGYIGNASITHTWTVTGSSDGIRKVCLMNTSGAWPYASGLFDAPLNLQNGDTLTVIYYPGFKSA